MIERLVFGHFFNVFSLLGGISQWILFCWFATRFGFEAPPSVHVLVPLALGVLNRTAARVYQGNPPLWPLVGMRARVVFAAAFVALGGAVALGATAAAWMAFGDVGTWPAEAGVLGAAALRLPETSTFRLLGDGAIALAVGTVLYGYGIGHRLLEVRDLTVPIANLPPALDGLRIVQVTDLHLGPLASRRLVREAFDAVNALDPDVVCVTGDIVDSEATDMDAWLPELQRLRARHGIFAVLGNHDRHVGSDVVTAKLGQYTSWRVLRDEVATLDVDGARLHLAGLDDRHRSVAAEAVPDLLAKLPEGEAAILLAHHPVVFPAAAAAGVSLTLVGHTHGGQLAVPGLPKVNVARVYLTRFDAGYFTKDGAQLYVSRGLGSSGQPLRVGVPREITVFTLTPARPAAPRRAA